MSLFNPSAPRAMVLTEKGYDAIGLALVPLLALPAYRDRRKVVDTPYDCDYQPQDGERETPRNLGYVGFFDFADEMVEAGYEQIRCPKCDLWHIWTKEVA